MVAPFGGCCNHRLGVLWVVKDNTSVRGRGCGSSVCDHFIVGASCVSSCDVETGLKLGVKRVRGQLKRDTSKHLLYILAA